MKYRLAPRALSDIAAIADYLQERNPAAAHNVRQALFDGIENLTRFPYMGRKQSLKNIRKWLVRKYPYAFYYRIHEADKEIVIISVCHQAEQRAIKDE